jgi:hypothetical protein
MRSNRRMIAAALAALALLAAVPASAAERHLGSTRLSRLENDLDILKMPPCRTKGKVREIQVRVARGSVEIEKLWVRFDNGDIDRLDIRERIPEGGRSRWIDLEGRKRCIDAIGIIGDTEKSGDQARVDFFGR